MKKLSKITESIWSDIQDRSGGDIRRKEDGKKVYTCLGIDAVIRNPKCQYDALIKNLLNPDCPYAIQIRVQQSEHKQKLEEKDPTVYDISNDKSHKFVATFWYYDEVEGFALDSSFADDVDEKDYYEICKCISSKLQEISQHIKFFPSRIQIIGKGIHGIPYYENSECFKLADISDWIYISKKTSLTLIDFRSDIIQKFPELSNIDLVLWNNCIMIPMNFESVIHLNEYKEFTEKWFKINETI